MRLFFTYFLLCVCSFGQVQFDLTNCIYQGISSSPLNGLTEYTMCAWAKPNGNPYNPISSIMGFNMDGAPSFENMIRLARFQDPTTCLVSDERLDNALFIFVHVDWDVSNMTYYVQTASSNGLSFYVNGILKTNSALPWWNTPINANQSAPTVVGATGFYNSPGYRSGWNGCIEDARIYSRALSALEISEIYNRPWTLSDDTSLVLRTCIVTNYTGSTLAGAAYNYGLGASGTYSNSPKAASGLIQHEKPRKATINID